MIPGQHFYHFTQHAGPPRRRVRRGCRGCVHPPQRMPLGTRTHRSTTVPDPARQHARPPHRAAAACASSQAAAACCALPAARTLPQARAAAPTLLRTFNDIHSTLLPLHRRSESRRRSHCPGEICTYAKSTPTHGKAHSPARTHSLPMCQRSSELFHCAPQEPTLAALVGPAAARSRTDRPRCTNASSMVHPHMWCGSSSVVAPLAAVAGCGV